MSDEYTGTSANYLEEALANPDEMETFFINAIRVGMVFGPSIGYFAQMREIRVTHNCEGFSPLLSLILLGSNTLRIYYWFGARFDVALLCQAIVMIFVQTGLVTVVLRAQMAAHSAAANTNSIGGSGGPLNNTPSRNPIVSSNDSSVHSESGIVPATVSGSPTGTVVGDYTGVPRNPRQLFKAISQGPAQAAEMLLFSPFPTAFETMTPILFYCKYVTMALIFLIVCTIIYGIGGWDAADYIGYTALMVEGCLYLPQIHLNYTRRSTEGVTWVLFCTWVIGDIAKLLYFIFDGQPFPFIVCSCFQLTCDAIMLVQVFMYRNNKRGPHDIASVMENGGAVSAASPNSGAEMNTLRNLSTGGPNVLSSASAVSGGPAVVGIGKNPNGSASMMGSNSNSDVIVSRNGQYGGTNAK